MVPGSQWTRTVALVPPKLHLKQKTVCRAGLALPAGNRPVC